MPDIGLGAEITPGNKADRAPIPEPTDSSERMFGGGVWLVMRTRILTLRPSGACGNNQGVTGSRDSVILSVIPSCNGACLKRKRTSNTNFVFYQILIICSSWIFALMVILKILH